MAKYRAYDFTCPSCGIREDAVLFDLETENPDEHVCACGEKMNRMFGAPMVMNAALPDGGRRSDDTWQRAKKIAELKCEHAEAPHGSEERKEIDKEIKARSVPITKGGG